MRSEIVPCTNEHVAAVQDFNARLRRWGAPAEFEFPDPSSYSWLPRTTGAKIYNEHYLVLVDGVVRGVFVLKQEEFALRGTVRSIVCCHHAYSEGVVNKTYAPIGPQIFKYCVSQYPLMYALGMRGYDQP